MNNAFGVVSKKSLAKQCLEDFITSKSYRSLKWSLWSFWVNFCVSYEGSSKIIFLHVYNPFVPVSFVEHTLHSRMDCLAIFVRNQSTINIRIYFWSSILFHPSTSDFMPVSHYLESINIECLAIFKWSLIFFKKLS